MLLVSICYILMAVGVPQILNLFRSNLSILFNVSMVTIQFGLTIGSIGSFIGKSICEFFITRYKYTSILCCSFLLSAVCFILEFCNPINLNVYSFYAVRIMQGFFSGLIYSTILANLGEFYSGEKYKNFLSIMTGSFGLAGPLFTILWIIWDFSTLVKFLISCAGIGALLSHYTVKNKKIVKNHIMIITENVKTSKSFFYYINLVLREKSIFFFGLSFALSLIGSLVILSNTTRLLVLYLQEMNYNINYIYVKAISGIPLLFGSIFFFPKKKASNYIRLTILLLSNTVFFLISKKIVFCFLALIFSYGVHLILIPVGSEMILNKQKRDRGYYSYIIHAIRSLYSIILQTIYFKYIDIYFTSFTVLMLFLLIINLMSFIFYFYGKHHILI